MRGFGSVSTKVVRAADRPGLVYPHPSGTWLAVARPGRLVHDGADLVRPRATPKVLPDLVLGPLLRHVGPTDATVWIETDAACEAGVLGCSSPTFRVAGHHYALVHVTGLEPGEAGEYEVHLDGEKVWPEPDSPFPPSVIRTPGDAQEVKLVFGSCRICAPYESPYTLGHEEDERGLGVDALYAMAMRLKDEPVEELPDALVLLGDQI